MSSAVDISVIVPMYNAARYIDGTLASVLQQDTGGFNLEVIVINDCSTDHSLEIVKRIRDERLVIIDLDKNVGLSEARNTGMRQARGEWIHFLDSDDTLGNNLYRRFRESLDGTSNVYLFGLLIHYPDHKIKLDIKEIRDKRVLGTFGVVVKFFIHRNLCIPFEKGYVFEDMIFNMELMNKRSLRIGLIREAYYHYNRTNEDSIMSNFSASEFERTFRLCYSRLSGYDRLTRMYFMEIYLVLLFDRTRPFGLSLKIAVWTLLRLFPLLPSLMFNTLKSQVKSEVLQ